MKNLSFKCNNCGKDNVFNIIECQNVNSEKCPYSLKPEKYNNKSISLILLFTSLVFLIAPSVAIYGLIKESNLLDSFFFFIITFTIPFYLGGIIFFLFSIFLYFGKQYTINSVTGYYFMIYKLFSINIGYSFNTPPKKINISTEESIDFLNISGYIINESDRKSSDNNEKTVVLIRKVLLYMLSTCILELKTNNSYNYIFNYQIKRNLPQQNYLLFPGKEFNKVSFEGLIEKNIINTIDNWQKLRSFGYCPLTPTIDELIKSIIDYKYGNPYSANTNKLRNDNYEKGIMIKNKKYYTFNQKYQSEINKLTDKLNHIDNKFKIYNKKDYDNITSQISNSLKKLEILD